MSKIKIILFGGMIIFFLSSTIKIFAGTLSCIVTSSCPSGVVIWRMSGTNNAHAELPDQTNYNQLICCSGVQGLGNSCTGTFAIVLKLSSPTNAHVEQNNQTNYPHNVCISVPSGGNISVGYQLNDCTGFDTTLGSISGVTNAHVGGPNAYPTKICATAGVSTISCTTPLTLTSFGTLDNQSVYTSSPNATTTITTNNPSGFTMKVYDVGDGNNPGLYKSTPPTDLIGSADANYADTATLSAGVEGYGIQATTTGPHLVIASRFAQTENNVGGLEVGSGNAVLLASSSLPVSSELITIIHKVAVSSANVAGDYSDTITYTCTAN